MRRILYVEDNKDTADAVKIILTNSGYEVKTAANGNEGIKLVDKEFFDLIMLDIMLPDMSGWDIFASLTKKSVKSKFAFLSAIPVSGERIEELKKAGVSGYITKPFTKKELVENVKRILKD